MLVIIPDGTRTAPIPLLFRLLYEQIGRRVARLDYLIALGTHPPMSDEAIDHLVGVTAVERAARYPNVTVFNHHWNVPEALQTIGTISRQEAADLTGGPAVRRGAGGAQQADLRLRPTADLRAGVPARGRRVLRRRQVLLPGYRRAEIVNFTHWLGALVTSMRLDRGQGYAGAAGDPPRGRVRAQPVLLLALVLKGSALHGLYIGPVQEAWNAAADLSAQLNIVRVPQAFQRVLSMPSEMYDDLWTAAKAMYKTEPAIADGGEVIIYAPHITEISYTPRRADRRGGLPRARLLPEAVGPLQGHAGRHPGPQHARQGPGHL